MTVLGYRMFNPCEATLTRARIVPVVRTKFKITCSDRANQHSLGECPF